MLKKIRQAKLGLGIEDDTSNPEAGAGGAGGSAPTDPIEPVGGAENTPEVAAADAAIDEVADAGEQVIDDGEVIEELDDAKAALEEIYEDMRVSLENGGMNADTARIANRYVNRTLKRVGMVNPMPSCEAFGGFGDRYVSTSVAMEGIGDNIKQLWEKIKTWFANMWKNIRVYWQKVWDAAPKLKARAEALRQKADGLGGKVAQEKQIEVGADIVKKLYVDQGKLPDAATMSKNMSTIGEMCKLLFGDYYGQSLKFIDALAEKMASLPEPTAANIKAMGLGNGAMISPLKAIIGKAPFNAVPATDEVVKTKIPDAQAYYSTGQIFGGKGVVAGHFTGKLGTVSMEADGDDEEADVDAMDNQDPKPGTGGTGGKQGGDNDPKPADDPSTDGVGAAIKAWAKNAIKVVTFETKARDVSEQQYATMPLGDVQKVCDEVIKLCDFIISYRKDWDKAEKSEAKIMRAGDNFARAAGKTSEKSGNDSSAVNALFDLTRTAGMWIAQPNQEFSRYAMESAKAALMVCDKSLAQYS